MTKTELIKQIAKKNGWTQKQTAQTVDAFLNAVGDTLAQGESVQLSGFGLFTVRTQAEHLARNPRTNEQVTVPQMRKISFGAGKTLKEKLHET